MTFDSLVALVGLAAAIYALLPRHRRLDMWLRITGVEITVLVVAVILIHYLQFYAVFASCGLVLSLPLARFGLTPESTSYLVIAATALFVWLRMRFYKLSSGHLARLRTLSEELLWQREYAELAGLTKTHLRNLATRFRSEPEAQDVTRLLLSHPDFVRETALTDPYFGLGVLDHDLYEKHEFLSIYIRELLATPSSALYFEVRNNQNLARGHRYELPASNRILHYLFADASVAKDLAVYRPIGESVLGELRALHFKTNGDPYLLPVDSFSDDNHADNQWRSLVFVGLRLFDIMVMEALHQQIAWHMWLYYLPTVTGHILANYSEDGPGVDSSNEWPTRYSYLLYEIISMQRNWIRSVRDLPNGNCHKTLADTAATHDNQHIPKSAILSLTQCVQKIAECERVGQQFKNYLLEMVFGLFRDLFQEQPALAACLLNAIRCPGGWCRPSRVYAKSVRSAWNACDQIPYHSQAKKQLEQALSDLAEQGTE